MCHTRVCACVCGNLGFCLECDKWVANSLLDDGVLSSPKQSIDVAVDSLRKVVDRLVRCQILVGLRNEACRVAARIQLHRSQRGEYPSREVVAELLKGILRSGAARHTTLKESGGLVRVALTELESDCLHLEPQACDLDSLRALLKRKVVVGDQIIVGGDERIVRLTVDVNRLSIDEVLLQASNVAHPLIDIVVPVVLLRVDQIDDVLGCAVDARAVPRPVRGEERRVFLRAA